MTLLHVTDAEGWAAVQRGPVAADGFWHLCTQAQLPFVLNRHFPDRRGLVVLHLDPAKLGEVRWEESEPGMDPFPHLYGPLLAAAVTAVVRVPAQSSKGDADRSSPS